MVRDPSTSHGRPASREQSGAGGPVGRVAGPATLLAWLVVLSSLAAPAPAAAVAGGSLSAAATAVTGAADDDAGWSVAASADLDGDGAGDLVVAAPGNDAGGRNAGAVAVFFGPVPAGTLGFGAADLTLVGAAPGDRAGHEVAVGDLDGDGRADLAVGAPGSDAGGNDSGAVYVVAGGADRAGAVNLSDADAVLAGVDGGDEAGWAVATVAGPDGADLLVGAPRADAAGPNAGAVYRLDGASLPANGSLSAAGRTLVGAAPGDKAGWSVAGAGDVDGDGAADVVVGAKSNDSAAENAGAVYVVVRHASGTATLPAGSPALVGVSAGDNAGFDVAAPGDVDGDGFADVVVGAPLSDAGGENAGTVYVVRGGPAPRNRSLSSAAVVLRGESVLDRAGWSVAEVGDAAGCDGRPDVLVGATWQDAAGDRAGAAYLVSGTRSPGTVPLSTAAARFAGVAAGDGAGHGLAGGADLNDDGTGDLVVGAPAAAGGSGAAYVVDGTCAAGTVPAATPSPTPSSTPTPLPSPTRSPTTEPSPTASTASTPTPSPVPVPTAPPTPTATPSPSASATAAIAGDDGPGVPAAVGATVAAGALAAAGWLALRRYG